MLALPGQNNNAAVAAVFIELINEAFGKHRLWREEGDLVNYFQGAIDFKARLNQALQTWLSAVGYAAGLLLRSLRDKADQWWYFLEDPSVPPDIASASSVRTQLLTHIPHFGKVTSKKPNFASR